MIKIWHSNRYKYNQEILGGFIMLAKRIEEVGTGNVLATEVFEDDYLMKLISIELSIPADSITLNDLKGISTLISISTTSGSDLNKIRSLKGLEYCENLKALNLTNHAVSDVAPILSLKQLEVLVLTNNRLDSIYLIGKHLINLEVLAVGSNKIDTITPALELKNLKKLYIQDNPIMDESLLYLNELKNLRELCLWGISETLQSEKDKFKKGMTLIHGEKDNIIRTYENPMETEISKIIQDITKAYAKETSKLIQDFSQDDEKIGEVQKALERILQLPQLA